MNTKEKRENAIDVARKLAGTPSLDGLSKAIPRLLESFKLEARPPVIHSLMFDFLGAGDGDAASAILSVYVASLEDIHEDVVKGLIKLYGQIPVVPDHHFRRDEWNKALATRHKLYQAILLELAKRWIDMLRRLQNKEAKPILEFFLEVSLNKDHSLRRDQWVLDAVREATKDVELTFSTLRSSILHVAESHYTSAMDYDHQALLAFARQLFIASVRHMGLEEMVGLLTARELR